MEISLILAGGVFEINRDCCFGMSVSHQIDHSGDFPLLDLVEKIRLIFRDPAVSRSFDSVSNVVETVAKLLTFHRNSAGPESVGGSHLPENIVIERPVTLILPFDAGPLIGSVILVVISHRAGFN